MVSPTAMQFLVISFLLVPSLLAYSGKFEHIVFNGGGVKAISHIGALKALKDFDYYKDNRYTFTNIGGSSAGCLIGFMVALDIDASELESLIYYVDVFSTIINFDSNLLNTGSLFQDSNSCMSSFFDTYTFLSKIVKLAALWVKEGSPGLSNEKQFADFIHNVILKLSPHYDSLTKKKIITFQDLYKQTGHNLVCFASRLADRTLVEFSIAKTPKTNVLKGIYASISIPGIFKPIIDINGDALVDGGLLNNFPISMNDNKYEPSKITLGLSLDEDPFSKNHSQVTPSILSENDDIFSFKRMGLFDFSEQLYGILFKRESMLISMDPRNKNRIIYLNSPLKTLETNVSSKIKSFALYRAYVATAAFLTNLKMNDKNEDKQTCLIAANR